MTGARAEQVFQSNDIGRCLDTTNATYILPVSERD